MRKGGIVVAYEADQIDLTARAGWSVVVTGTAALVQNDADVTRYEILLHSWVDLDTDCVIRIQADLVDGYELRPF